MFSLPQQSSSFLVLVNLVLLFSVFLLQERALKYPFTVPRSNRVISIIIMFLFVLFSFWGEDWFHYLEAYPILCSGESGHMEDVYVWIAQHLSIGYISFRFAVWGIGLILLLLTIERLPLKKDLIFLFFGSLWIIWFSYARVSLGLALGFWGLSVIYHPYRNKILSKALAIAAISFSFFFHKTSFVVIVAIVLTILSIRFSRRQFFLIVIISIPLLLFYISNNIDELFMVDADASEGALDQTIYYSQQYLGTKNRSKGVAVQIAQLLGSIPYYLLLAQGLLVRKRDSYAVSKVVRSFIHLFFILMAIATLFSFDLGVNTSLLYTRFLRFAAFPSAVLLAYFWEYRYYPKLTKWTFYMAALSTMYSVSYSLYLKA